MPAVDEHHASPSLCASLLTSPSLSSFPSSRALPIVATELVLEAQPLLYDILHLLFSPALPPDPSCLALIFIPIYEDTADIRKSSSSSAKPSFSCARRAPRRLCFALLRLMRSLALWPRH